MQLDIGNKPTIRFVYGNQITCFRGYYHFFPDGQKGMHVRSPCKSHMWTKTGLLKA